MARGTDLFPTVTTDGGLLTSDLLARIAGGDRALLGLRPEDYHLAPGERLGEMINRSWNRLVGAWTGFSEALSRQPPGDAATGLTRERWLLVLFSELGYGRLQLAEPIAINDVAYPISHIWAGVPIHLVGARVDLDRRTAGVAGAARRSPHSLVQELLNRSPERLWGIVGNGFKLRLLRDNASLTRQAFVEFDIAAMMNGEVYSDFALLWLIFHESRFAGDPAECWLEQWMGEADVRGTRALDHLRGAVQEAIVALGSGFLSQPANAELRDGLRLGELSPRDYYRLVLRLVYRLLFLFVAEDRDLLHTGETLPEIRDLYHRWYSVDRLRRLAERRRFSAHYNLYESLKVVMSALDELGLDALGLPGLGSFLWARDAIGALGTSRIGNRDLLAGVRALAFIRQSGARRPVDYRNLGPEELGSVYESLLELHPQVHLETGLFELSAGAASERKSTGSYYTPTSLINSLLDTALQPVLAEAASKPNAEHAVLQLKVIDPACGSGHFLLAAAGRIAKRLASIRTGDEEASPGAVRLALRDVIASCVYGVDRNDMAIELCKVNLWLESLEPGKPLAFLEHHIVLGDSLLGTTPALVAGGLPDDAFLPIEGDDPQLVRSLRKANRVEREGQTTIPFKRAVPVSELVHEMSEIEAAGQDSIAQIRTKEARFRKLTTSREAAQTRLIADAWCAAFMAPKALGWPSISQDVLRRLADAENGVEVEVVDLVRDIASQFKFHHWYLAFPQVFSVPGGGPCGWAGGFDVVLGNPPWEMLQLDDREFFAIGRPDLANEPRMALRKVAIEKLKTSDPALYANYSDALRGMEAVQNFIHSSGRFPLSSFGRINTAPLFVEMSRSILRPGGRSGLIVPTGIATDAFNQHLFRALADEGAIASLYNFENRDGLFPAVDSRQKFCLLTMVGGGAHEGPSEFAFFLRRVEDLRDPERRFPLSSSDFALLNPNTRTSPIFRSRRDAEMVKAIYQRVPVLMRNGNAEGNSWNLRFQLMFMMNTDSGLFATQAELELAGAQLEGNVFTGLKERWLPLYEGKMFHHFDHRWATFDGANFVDLLIDKKTDPDTVVLPRYWVREADVRDRLAELKVPWLLAWRDIARATDERTVVASVLPWSAVANSAPLLVPTTDPLLIACLAGCLSSLAFDFVARFKVGGTHINFFILEQLPVLPPSTFISPSAWTGREPLATWLRPRLLELIYSARDLQPFAQTLLWDGAPHRWDPRRRESVRAEVDAAFFYLYGFARGDIEYALDNFQVLARNEERAYGEYRTRRLVLNAYDRLLESSSVPAG